MEEFESLHYIEIEKNNLFFLNGSFYTFSKLNWKLVQKCENQQIRLRRRKKKREVGGGERIDNPGSYENSVFYKK